MATRKKKDELSEWPRTLESVDIAPDVKWPRRLAVPDNEKHEPCYIFNEAGQITGGYTVVRAVEDARGVRYQGRIYQGKVEHAGGGFVRITPPDASDNPWVARLTDITPLYVVMLPFPVSGARKCGNT